ncbi:hypothetical protein FACS189468_6910 [Spirochaetia bacterium]|nr:hypothetical protein FACS189468_6910 [Spirochaetia bacterium]
MAQVVTFGEIMLRLAPEGYYRFVQTDNLLATFGGGEANVAVSLANFALETAVCYQAAFPRYRPGGGQQSVALWG